MGRQIASRFVQINRPIRKSQAEVIAEIIAQDKAEDRAERAAKRKFEQWWRQKVETANRGAQKRRLAKQGTILKHGHGVCTLTLQEWREIIARYQSRCAYCQKKRLLTKDHIVPISQGGFHTHINVIPACRSCNSRKGNRPAHLYAPKLIPFN